MTRTVYLLAGLLALLTAPVLLWLIFEPGSTIAAIAEHGAPAVTASPLVRGVGVLVVLIAVLFFAFARRMLVAVAGWAALLTPGIWHLAREWGHARSATETIALVLLAAILATPAILVLRGTFKGRRWR
jgi:hypothetical protein